MLGNPKVLLFFGAFIPQFVDARHEASQQIVLLGATAMVVATLSDGLYALLAARAGAILSRGRVRLVSRLGGASLIGGGVLLALTRAR
jgi:threonine/homoserine/homoserine lactone efflux protein